MALLGTPNGAGGVYLLMQHKRALGLKTISRVHVGFEWIGGRWLPFLIFEVVDMRASEGLLDVGSGRCNSSNF